MQPGAVGRVVGLSEPVGVQPGGDRGDAHVQLDMTMVGEQLFHRVQQFNVDVFPGREADQHRCAARNSKIGAVTQHRREPGADMRPAFRGLHQNGQRPTQIHRRLVTPGCQQPRQRRRRPRVRIEVPPVADVGELQREEILPQPVRIQRFQQQRTVRRRITQCMIVQNLSGGVLGDGQPDPQEHTGRQVIGQRPGQRRGEHRPPHYPRAGHHRLAGLLMQPPPMIPLPAQQIRRQRARIGRGGPPGPGRVHRDQRRHVHRQHQRERLVVRQPDRRTDSGKVGHPEQVGEPGRRRGEQPGPGRSSPRDRAEPLPADPDILPVEPVRQRLPPVRRRPGHQQHPYRPGGEVPVRQQREHVPHRPPLGVVDNDQHPAPGG